ncbi:DUF4246 domain-containing protein ASCRUDRAFT_38134 [Ascoidea rubescens DSM 1968]|uniref:DUF4246 domain-containing protein n=1 Tax=Ascoidea rubescens DSM 1968 TaxID=1344418 RepID=A0A1D2VBP7_9ASCO|nr:hypothetical protein ASCRUDRAFT_38134 [Ascoidea rubescens DSM 1968]ODV59035.1 hypothetical protein ASCRUDRAFT_38134 [Ascoidea rubescens DSM 1968]
MISNLEYSIHELSYQIRLKPNWTLKYKNPEIRKKWESEIESQIKRGYNFPYNSREIIEYIFDQLKYFEYLQNLTTDKYTVGAIDYIFFNDNVVDPLLKKKFSDNVREFESNEPRDYHPGSNDQILDLVHPSLYTLRYGFTPVFDGENFKIVQLSDSYQDETADPYDESHEVSEKFQWLPTIFQYNSSSDKYKAQSYINNLHPIKYKKLYRNIEDIFNCCLNGLSLVLTKSSKSDDYNLLTKYIEVPYADLEKTSEALNYHAQNKLDNEIEKLYYNGTSLKHLKPFSNLSLKFSATKDDYKIDLINLKEKYPELKVIVKLANIELTPEKPNYKGGSWHVEGCDNEKIVCTILYYYEMTNIVESKIRFRAAVDTEEFMEYEQNADGPVLDLYGLSRDRRSVREQGNIDCKEDRILIFPNFLQHHVDKFELKDKSKNGTRKILCFFIVDPSDAGYHVFSTSDVPIQQKEWWDDKLFNAELKEDYLSDETKEDIQSLIKQTEKPFEWPITLDESKKLREELIKERSIKKDNADLPFNREFSLCEH